MIGRTMMRSHFVNYRGAMSMVELTVIGAIGLMISGLIVSLLTTAWKQDTWTEGRLNAIASICSTMENVKQDLLYADAGLTEPDKAQLSLRVKKPGAAVEVATYSWAGAGKNLMRSGKSLGFTKPENFGVKVEEEVAVLEMTLPSSTNGKTVHQTKLAVPLAIPEVYWQEKLAYWAPRVP